VIKLYGCGSPNVRKVVIMLEELGLDYEISFVGVMNGAQFEPSFLALNPLGRVPVLVDPEGPAGEPIFESGAILIYLAEAYGRQDLLPAAGRERYAVMKWLMLQMANVGPIFGQHNHFIITPEHANSYAGRRYREQATRLYHFLDQRLAEVSWLAGGDYSIADIATYPWALYVERHGLQWDDLPYLKAWRDRIEARPALGPVDVTMQRFVADDMKDVGNATQESFNRFFWREGDEGPEVDLTPMIAEHVKSR
jgi:GST-like protein